MKLNHALTAAGATASIRLGTIAQESVKCLYCHSPGPILVAALSKAWVCGRSLAGIVGSNPAGNMECVVSVVCC
jgi:hypothetical protein